MKIKTLYDIDMEEWNGRDVLSGASPPVKTGASFCVVSFHQLPTRERSMRDYDITVSGLNNGSSFILRQGSKSLPVTLRLRGRSNTNSHISNQSLFNNTITVNGLNSDSLCRKYQYTIRAEISSSDILQYQAVGRYEGTFVLRANSISPAQEIEQDFKVSINLTPAYQVTRLRDVHLSESSMSPDGRWYLEDVRFCVFAMGAQHYKMSVNSQLRPSGRFEIRNDSGAGIPYRINILQGGNNWKIFHQEGSTDPGTLTGSGALNCNGRTNVTLRIDMQTANVAGKPSGVYRDVMVVTVGPE